MPLDFEDLSPFLRDRAPIRFLTERTDNLSTRLEATNDYKQKGENSRATKT